MADVAYDIAPGLDASGNLAYSLGLGGKSAFSTPDFALGDGREFTKEQLLQALRHEQPVAGITYMG